MSYVIEILSIGGDFYSDIQNVTHPLNDHQLEFQFTIPPPRLKGYGLSFSQQEYHTDDIYSFLEKYKSEARGNRPFLIAVVNSSLRSNKLRNIFGSHDASRGFAVFTLKDDARYADSRPRFICYYLARYALSFVAPLLKAHEETRACLFDKKMNKGDLKRSLNTAGLCDACLKSLQGSFNEEIYKAILEMRSVLKGLESDDQAGTAPTEKKALAEESLASNHPNTTGIGTPRVYISYTARTPGLKQKALRWAEKLRDSGIDSRIDSFHGKSLHGFTPPPPLANRDAWDHWQEEQVRLADRILVICTPEAVSPLTGSGFDRDLRYMEADLMAGAKDRNKFIPVGIGPFEANRQYVPAFMRGATYYDLGLPQQGLFGLSDLINRLKTEFSASQMPKSLGKPRKKRASNANRKKTNTPDAPLKAGHLKGKIHAAIIAIRVDEYEAMEATLGSVQSVEGNNSYKLAQVTPAQGAPISVVLTRVVRQGNASAQGVASNIINELDPSWLILVGIAGGVPDPEFSLGDVGLTTYLHDFSLTAASNGNETYEAGGGNMHRDVERFLATRVVGQDREKLYKLAGFDSGTGLPAHPDVYPASIPDGERYYGTDSHKKKVQQTIARRFPGGKRSGGPVVTLGPCANGNVLLKDAGLLNQWQQSARQVIQVEMELSGVYEAARTAGRENYPVLAIRGISDIVGFARHPDWTGYACKTAAAFASAVLKSGLINFAKNLPKTR